MSARPQNGDGFRSLPVLAPLPRQGSRRELGWLAPRRASKHCLSQDLMKEGTRVVVALASAFAIGAAIAASGSAQALALADHVAPIGALWVTAIRMTVI